jgi:ATP/maltotriose-dependent transcriptional regulator MalT
MRAFDRSPVPFVLVDERRRFVEANHSARLFLRLSEAELRGCSIDDLTPSRRLRALAAAWGRLMDARSVTGSYELVGPGGAGILLDYWALADALPGLHLVAFAPSGWPEEELGVSKADGAGPLVPPLTPREREVLQLAAEGLSGPDIAQRLVVSTATVKTHFANIYEKLGVGDRTAAVASGLRFGLID